MARQSNTLDWFLKLVADNSIIKNIPAAMMFFFLWFSPAPDLREKRKKLLALLPIAFVAVAVGKGLAVLLPFRERPLHEPDLAYLVLPHSVTREILDGWSSFPSDHAVLFAALITCFWLVRRWAGLLMVAHALFVIGFVRMFLLYHYPTDLLGGALIGVAIALLMMPPLLYLTNRMRLLELGERWPQFMYPVIFLLLHQITSLFGGFRDLAEALVDLVT